MGQRSSVKDLRCFCKANLKLAEYGLDAVGKVFVHIKIYKAGKVFGEVKSTSGDLKIRCRACGRWHIVLIRVNDAVLRHDHSTG